MFSGRVTCKRADFGHRSEISQIQSMSHLQRVYKAGTLALLRSCELCPRIFLLLLLTAIWPYTARNLYPSRQKNGDTLQPRVVRDHNANSVCLECNICGNLIERADVYGYMRRHRSSKVCRTVMRVNDQEPAVKSSDHD